jgi:hypothetical protein
MTTALNSRDNKTCGNCYLRSTRLNVCLLTSNEIKKGRTCKKWFPEDKIPKMGEIGEMKNEERGGEKGE